MYKLTSSIPIIDTTIKEDQVEPKQDDLNEKDIWIGEPTIYKNATEFHKSYPQILPFIDSMFYLISYN